MKYDPRVRRTGVIILGHLLESLSSLIASVALEGSAIGGAATWAWGHHKAGEGAEVTSFFH
jgi:hypothetical protein